MTKRASPWFRIEPINGQSRAMLNFYLEQVQTFLEAARMGKGRGITLEKWLDEYLLKNTVATLAPKKIYLLSYRLDVVDPPPTRGKNKRQAKHLRFILPPRSGWAKERKKNKKVAWDDYQDKMPPIPVGDDDNRVITPDKAETELLEQSLLRWSWGGVKLLGEFHDRLERFVEESGRPWNNGQDFLKKVRYLIVQKVASQEEEPEGTWKVMFVLKETR